MRVSGRWKLLLPPALLGVTLASCQLPPHVPAAPSAQATPTPPVAAPRLGTPYDVVPEASLLVILVYRAGALASAGHNHVIASHELTGTLYVPGDVTRASFELHLPVTTLTVDEATLRAQQPGADFASDVSEGAKEGTRRNMLGAALLDAEHNPEIVLRGAGIASAAAPSGGASAVSAASAASDTHAVVARVESTVRGQQHSFNVPLCYRLGDGVLTATGELALRQSELGLTPFSAMLGALQVQDEMRIRFRIVARAAGSSAAGSSAAGGSAAGTGAASAAPPTAAAPDTPCAAPR
jgi:YceI-like domain